MLDKLLPQVMKGNQAGAETILQIRPDLLFKAGTAVDYSGRKIHLHGISICFMGMGYLIPR